jgi:hypothetical protein
MKALLQFVFPTVKAVLTVVGFMLGLGWGAYHAVEVIAKAQGEVIEAKVIAVRNADFQHINSRFDRTDDKLDKIMVLIQEQR